MRQYQFTILKLITCMAFLLGNCSPPPATPTTINGIETDSVQVNESEVSTDTTAEPIYLNNCGNQAQSQQTSERSQTISIDIQGQFKGSLKAVEASVAAKYITTKGIKKSQTVTAFPNTNMKFILLWTEEVTEGTVTVKDQSGQAIYKVSIPISVKQESAEDLGCPTTPTPPTASLVPTAVLEPTREVSLDTPVGTELSESQFWRTDGAGLQLTGHYYDLSNRCAAFSFDMTNASNEDLIVTILPDQFTATDNTGHTWTTHALSDTNYCAMDSGPPNTGQLTIEVPSGKNNTGGSNQWIISFVGPISDPQVTSLRIVVNGLSRFTNATWVIEIGR